MRCYFFDLEEGPGNKQKRKGLNIHLYYKFVGLTMPYTALSRGYMFSQSSTDWNINASAYKDPGDHLVQPFHLIDEDTEAQRRKQLCSRLYRKLGGTASL